MTSCAKRRHAIIVHFIAKLCLHQFPNKMIHVIIIIIIYTVFIPGVSEKAEQLIFDTQRIKIVTYFIACDTTFSSEKNDTMIIKFVSLIQILW